MAFQKNRNELFRKIIGLLYSKYISANQNGSSHYLEFFGGSDFDKTNINFIDCYPDPNGILTGLSFQLAGRGLVIPSVIQRWGGANFAFTLTDDGKSLFENKGEFEKQFPSADDDTAFIIMSFSDNKNLKDTYELGIKSVVKKCGFNCIRVDEIEHNRRITEKVIECISKSKFIIADLTEQRPNCYYELGFAHALQKEVIHIIKENEPIHFDIKDYNFIIYSSISELAERLEDRILKTIKINL